jgi:hypothetical protein
MSELKEFFESGSGWAFIIILLRTLIAMTKQEFYDHDGDAKCHLAILKTFRVKKIRYPTGFHAVSSILGVKLNEKFPGLFNLIIWGLFVVLLNQYEEINLYSALYLLAFSLLIDDYNSHQYGYTERLCAQLSCSVVFGILLLDINFLWSLPLYAWIIYSSKFGRQFMVFVCVPSLLILGQFNDLLYLVVLVSLILLLSPHLREGLIHQVKWSKNYNKGSTIPLSKKWRPVYEFHFLRLLLFPELFLIYGYNVELFALVLAVFFLISFRKLSFVGESWRYLDWAVLFPTCILIGPESVYILILKLLGFYLYQAISYFVLRPKSLNTYKSDALDITDFLREKGAIFPIPYRTGDDLMSVDPHADLALWWPVDGNECMGTLPSKGTSRYDKKYIKDAKWIVASKSLLCAVDYEYYPDVLKSTPTYSNSSYLVFESP